MTPDPQSLIRAREIVAKRLRECSYHRDAGKVERGFEDDCIHMRIALDALAEQGAEARRGYYQACDEVAHWMNATDSGEMTVKQFRSALNLKLLSMHPNGSSIAEARRAAIEECARVVEAPPIFETYHEGNLMRHKGAEAIRSLATSTEKEEG